MTPATATADEVRALLEDRKTQWRVPVNDQPPEGWAPEVGFYEPTKVDRHGEEYPGKPIFGASDESWGVECPWSVGQRLWVKEGWRWYGRDRGEGPEGGLEYRADLAHRTFTDFAEAHESWEVFEMEWRKVRVNQWRSPQHLPLWAARIHLEITGIRCELLWKINEAGVLAEGIGPEHLEKNRKFFHKDDVAGITFAEFWNARHKRGPTWEDNPWCWVREIKRVEVQE